MEIPNRAQHDDDAAALLATLAARHRYELQRLLGNPPDLANVPDEFWERVRRETEDELLAILLLVFMASAQLHGASSGEAYNAGTLWAGTKARELADVYAANSLETIATASAEWQQRTAAGNRPTVAEVTERTTTIFGPSRAARMAVDAVTTGQSFGGEWAANHLGYASEDDLWINQPQMSKSGPCPICTPLHLQPRSVWAAIYPMGPPGPHPGCVCIVRYSAVAAAPSN